MNRIEIKEQAKEIVKENLKEFWLAYAILIVISFLCGLGIDLLFEKGTIIYYSLTVFTSFFTLTLSVGFYSYVLKMIRKEKFEREDLFNYVGKILPITCISILVSILCFLWSILLIIPGIIAALNYSMVFMVYIDSKEMSPMDYLDKSKELMKGYLGDYFVFGLSFLGWILFSIITLGIGLIWTLPYITIANTIYYNELRKIKEKE